MIRIITGAAFGVAIVVAALLVSTHHPVGDTIGPAAVALLAAAGFIADGISSRVEQRRPARQLEDELATEELGERRSSEPFTIETRRLKYAPWSLAFPASMPDGRSVERLKPGPDEVNVWLREQGAVDFRETRVHLAIRNRTKPTLIVRDIRLEVRRYDAYAGTLVTCPTAGANKATLLVVDLDAAEPLLWEWEEDGARKQVGSMPFFDAHHVAIDKGQVHDFVIVAIAHRSRCVWNLLVTIEMGDEEKIVRVDGDDAGRFETTGEPDGAFISRLHWAWYEGGRFLPEPDLGVG